MGAAQVDKSAGPHSVKSGGAIRAVRANGLLAARPETPYSPPNAKKHISPIELPEWRFSVTIYTVTRYYSTGNSRVSLSEKGDLGSFVEEGGG